jgi:glycine hydroxymethyltransferase
MSQVLDSYVFPGVQGGPLEHVIAAKAVAFFEALQPEFTQYQKQVVANAKAMCSEFLRRGYKVVSGGTDNHLFLIDFTRTHPQLSGKDVQEALDRVHITLNKNCVPNEQRSPSVTSGVRIGTAAMTTRHFGPEQFIATAHLIDEAVRALADGTFTDETAKAIGEKARALIAQVS